MGTKKQIEELQKININLLRTTIRQQGTIKQMRQLLEKSKAYLKKNGGDDIYEKGHIYQKLKEYLTNHL